MLGKTKKGLSAVARTAVSFFSLRGAGLCLLARCVRGWSGASSLCLVRERGASFAPPSRARLLARARIATLPVLKTILAGLRRSCCFGGRDNPHSSPGVWRRGRNLLSHAHTYTHTHARTHARCRLPPPGRHAAFAQLHLTSAGRRPRLGPRSSLPPPRPGSMGPPPPSP